MSWHVYFLANVFKTLLYNWINWKLYMCIWMHFDQLPENAFNGVQQSGLNNSTLSIIKITLESSNLMRIKTIATSYSTNLHPNKHQISVYLNKHEIHVISIYVDNPFYRYNRFSHTTYMDTGCILIVSLFLAAIPP